MKMALTLLAAMLLLPMAGAAEPGPVSDTPETAPPPATQGTTDSAAPTDGKPTAQATDNAPAAESPTRPPVGPSLRSTARMYREYAYLNDECRREFGPAARVADWSDVKRMVKSRNEYEDFLKTNGLDGKSRERLLYFNGLFKSPRDKHYYLIFNPDGETPNGVNAIDRLRGNRLNLAAIMHIRARVLCFVP